jgi:uncharacterized membrane protein
MADLPKGFDMPQASDRWTDEKMEQIIGILLRAGVIAASAVVLSGGIWYLVRCGAQRPDYRTFHGEPPDLRNVSGIIHGAFSLEPQNIIQFGILLLIATPIARVAFSLVAFALERDRAYVIITIIVLAILIYSLASGH